MTNIEAAAEDQVHLFDTHFHYTGKTPPEEYRRNILAESSRAGFPLSALELNAVGGDFRESVLARDFAHAVPDCVFSAGVHPGNADGFEGDTAQFDLFRDDPLLAAVGELGLDYYYDADTAPRQRRVFGAFLELALLWDKPAVVHLRDKGDDASFRDGMALLGDFAGRGGRFEIHCFTGGTAWCEKFVALGGYIGITGMVTFRQAENIREIARRVPVDRLLLETDSPYLAPVPFRGRENHPGLLGFTAAAVAELRGMETASLCALAAENARRFFRLEARKVHVSKMESC